MDAGKAVRKAMIVAKTAAQSIGGDGFTRVQRAAGGRSAPRQTITSADTSIKQVPALLKTIPKVVEGHRNLDIGGGKFDLGTQHLASRGIESHVYDPFNRPQEHNDAVLKSFADSPADSVTAANVLNVIRHPQHRNGVIETAHKFLAPGQDAHFGIYEGDRSGDGAETSKGWQNNRRAQSYVDEVRKVFGNADRRGNVIVARKADRPGFAAGGAPEGDTPTFYSALDQGVAGAKQMQAPAQDWPNIISKLPGVKQEEIEARGLHEFLGQQQGMVPRDAIMQHLKQTPFGINEAWKGGNHSADDYSVQQHGSRGEYAIHNESGEPVGGVFPNRADAENNLRNWRGQNGTKYSSYQMPLGKNYKELLLTLPREDGSRVEESKNSFGNPRYRIIDANGEVRRDGVGNPAWWPDRDTAERSRKRTSEGSYKSTHWDEPNVLAHVRMNDRRGPNGEKLLHVEEIQSDWHQEGREKGYRGGPKRFFSVQNKASGNRSQLFNTMDEVRAYRQSLPEGLRPNTVIREHLAPDDRHMVPNAPFKDTKAWTELAMKKVIRHAADNGYDGVTWTPGDIQADRYDLSKRLSRVDYNKETNHLMAYAHETDRRGHPVALFDKEVGPDELHNHVGKDLAKKLMDMGRDEEGYASAEGLDLKVGGEGMREYYDKIVPSVANKLGKEHGVKAGHINVASDKDPQGPFRVIRPPEGSNSGSWHLSNDAGDIVHSAPTEDEIRAKHREMEDGDGRARVHYLKVTPSMKKKAMKQFKRGGAVSPKVDAAIKIASRVVKKVAGG